MPDYVANNLDYVLNPTVDYCCSVKYIPNAYIEAVTSKDSIKLSETIEKEMNACKSEQYI